MRRINLLILGIMLHSSMYAFAGNEKEVIKTAERTATVSHQTISGKVIDVSSGEALSGVCVKIEGTSHEVFTDFEGRFNFSNLSVNSGMISASFISYEKTSISIDPSHTSGLILSLKSIF